MAHFAKLDENNYVTEIHVVANEVLDLQNEETTGIEFLTEWSGGYTNWKQTSYNSKIRKNYAGIGYFYDEDLDAFIPPKAKCHYEETFNEVTCRWECLHEDHFIKTPSLLNDGN
jgi:hypothetical protein